MTVARALHRRLGDPRSLRAIGRRGVVLGALLALVVAGALVLRLEAAADRPGRSSADERAYVRLARDLRAGTGYGDAGLAHPLHWAPGAPALFALADAVSGHAAGSRIDTRAGRRAQAVVGALTVGAAFALAALVAGAVAGLVAAAAVAFYPPMVAATAHLTSEPLGALAITAALAAVAWAWARAGPRAFVVAGAVAGAACLVRADLLLAVLVLVPAVGILHARRAGWRAGTAVAGALLAGVLVLVAPWSIWASRAAGTFVPITDGASSTLLVATYLPGDGTIFGFKHAMAAETRRVHPELRHTRVFRIPEKEIMDAVAARHPHLSHDAAITAELHRNLRVYLLGHPVAFAGMTARKAWRMWGFPFRGTFHRNSAATVWIHRALVALALLGLLAGVFVARSAALGLVLVALCTNVAVNLAFVSEARHAFRLMPALLAAGAAGCALAVAARRRQSAGRANAYDARISASTTASSVSSRGA
ncbi:MAG: hypothetical protein QOH72_5287 [Solirubrobacteraceae bacterium]|nr:hypothetical protein [Solirubrobacteraceae bacterium]